MSPMRHVFVLLATCSLVLLVLLLFDTSGGAQALLVSSTPIGRSRAWSCFAQESARAATLRTGRIATRQSVLRMAPGPPSTRTSNNQGGPRGSRPSDSVTREGFVAGAIGIVTAGLAPEILTDPSGPPSYDVTHERIFDTRKNSFLPADPARLIVPGIGFSERVLCLGEVHTHPMHHRMQFNVMKATYAVTRSLGEPLAIGLEMFYRQQQGPLDRYIFNHGDLRLLKLETQWDQTWGFDFNQYAKIFHYAREQGIRLVGLNAPASLLYLVNKLGVEGLPTKVRELLPEMDLGQEAHRRRFEETIGGFQHGGGIDDAAMTRLYEAQTLWDEYMAETTSMYLKRAGGRIVLLAGNGHVQARDGIPDRVQRRTGLKPFTVVPVNVGWTTEGLPDIDHPPGRSFADWVYFTQREIGPPQRGAGSEQSTMNA